MTNSCLDIKELKNLLAFVIKGIVLNKTKEKQLAEQGCMMKYIFQKN